MSKHHIFSSIARSGPVSPEEVERMRAARDEGDDSAFLPAEVIEARRIGEYRNMPIDDDAFQYALREKQIRDLTVVVPRSQVIHDFFLRSPVSV